MKKIKLIFLAIGLIALAAGCGLEKSAKNYQVVTGSATDTGLTVTYSIKSVSSTEATGYAILNTTSGTSTNISVSNFYSSSTDFYVPQITLSRLQVAYSIDSDTAGILGAWVPTPVDTAINIVLPRTKSQSTITTNLSPVLSNAHMAEVAGKILAANALLQPGGTYFFHISLLSNILVRADVTLSGVDENGAAVSTGFSTNISYLANYAAAQ
jgi:hypothetical protein